MLKAFLLLVMFLCTISSDAQIDSIQCLLTGLSGESSTSGSFTGGRYKPHRSDIGGAPSNHYFPVLVVFVSFLNEPSFTSTDTTTIDHWPYNRKPNYMNSLITKNRNEQSGWWDAYNNFAISDYWHEISRGSLHVLGEAIYIQLGQTKDWYYALYRSRDSCEAKMKKDVYDSLKNNPNIDWQFYDQWTTLGEGDFDWDPDGLLDMLYLVFRSRSGGNISSGVAAGIAELGPCFGSSGGLYGDYIVYLSGNDTVRINSGFGNFGSGTKTDGHSTGRYSRINTMDIITHEHGHYLLGGGHNIYCKVLSGAQGEYSFNPWEMIKLDWIRKQTVTYGNNIFLGDYSSRDDNAGTTGEILEIPIDQNGNEFFLIANRRKIASFDRTMGGDTLADDGYQYLKNMNAEYGKGVYIYHITGGYTWSGNNNMNFDMECADGIWNWEQHGTASPIWNPNTLHPVFRKVTPSYVQDNPAAGITANGRDGRSLRMTGTVLGGSVLSYNWYLFGNAHSSNPYASGTDRLWTNNEDPWFALETNGDRYDAWNLGYNEIFSPWSSPNTKNWSGNQSDIYVWYKGFSSSTNEAEFEIYKVGVNSETEATILEKTPPSKPMMHNIEEYWNGTTCNPKIIWQQNSEPDMARTGSSEALVKRYKIYKTGNINGMQYQLNDRQFYPELSYQHVATVDVANSETTGYWIDPNVNMYNCSQVGHQSGFPYPVRYRVQAIDKFDDASVLSDFRSSKGVNEGEGDPGNEDNLNNNLPGETRIFQNYPNPFNPVTNIRYEITIPESVNIKIYNLLGEEILTLVNGFRNAGTYIVSFNGSELSSGVYFYKIEAGNFKAVKRMVLLK